MAYRTWRPDLSCSSQLPAEQMQNPWITPTLNHLVSSEFDPEGTKSQCSFVTIIHTVNGLNSGVSAARLMRSSKCSTSFPGLLRTRLREREVLLGAAVGDWRLNYDNLSKVILRDKWQVFIRSDITNQYHQTTFVTQSSGRVVGRHYFAFTPDLHTQQPTQQHKVPVVMVAKWTVVLIKAKEKPGSTQCF